MDTITIADEEYVDVKDMMSSAPIYCGKSRSSRALIKKKKIDKSNYIFARLTDGVWTETNGKSVKFDRLMLRKDYVDTCEELVNELGGEQVSDDNGVMKAPDVIELTDEEKFQDEDGNVLEIETRGEKTEDGIYFLVKDVADGFQMASLYKTILNSDTCYKQGSDYQYFICEIYQDLGKLTTKKELFLTYPGILRVLFSSQSGIAERFRKWATNILFTIQMGSQEAKETLCDKIMGSSAKMGLDVFKRSAKPISCVYLFSLGRVSDLRDTMGIDESYADEGIVCKFGLTNNIQRRTKDHMKAYGKIAGTELRIVKYSIIDAEFIQEAENNLKILFTQYKLEYENETELVVIEEGFLKQVKDFYELINKRYIGEMKNFDNQIKMLEIELSHEREKVARTEQLLQERTEHYEQLREADRQLREADQKYIRILERVAQIN